MSEPTIGTRIIHLRQSLDLSQDTFGSKIGVTKSTVSLIERGLRTPSDRTVRDICREFSTSEEWLRNGTGDMFVQLSKEDEIAQFVENLINCEDDSFKKRFVSALSVLDESEWEVLEKIANNLVKHKELIPFSGKKLEEPEQQILNAAHERTDIKVTDKMKKHDDDLMDNDEFWK